MAVPAPEPDPIKIEFKKWKHRERGYIVSVTEVRNFRGKHGYHTVVVVERKGEPALRSWPAKTFLRTFEPYGRRLKIRSRWARLGED